MNLNSWRTRRPSSLCIATAIAVSLGYSTAARCQVKAGMRVQDFGINAAIGVVTATAWSLVRGRGLMPGLRNGLIGGATIAAGRQVAASPFSGSGFVGRQISSAGISLITASGSDHMTMAFPIGPVRIQVKDGGAIDWRLNATDAVDAIANSVRSETRLDIGLSVSSGTFVFRDTRATFSTGGATSVEAIGEEELGNIKLARDAFYRLGEPRALYHENVHVLQEDYLSEAVANPIEHAILDRLHVSKRITRHIDLGILSSQIVFIANSAIPYSARPWEREAYALTPQHDY